MPVNRQFRITDARSGAAITVRVISGSPKTEVAGLQEGVLKIRLVAAAHGAPEANEELVSFLAEQLNIPTGNIDIVAGVNGRDKIISIEGLNTAQVEQILLSDVTE
jgi:uncharacterized protein YggU (UPF0235/DUF167 family)